MVSHELRTPLTSIRAFAEILRDAEAMPAEKQQHFLEIIVRESERLSRLIEEILDLARLESGRMTLNPERCDLVELVQQSVDAVTRLYEDRAVKLALKLPDSSCMVYCRPGPIAAGTDQSARQCQQVRQRCGFTGSADPSAAQTALSHSGGR